MQDFCAVGCNEYVRAPPSKCLLDRKFITENLLTEGALFLCRNEKNTTGGADAERDSDVAGRH